MTRCNVEFYDHKLKYIYHDSTETIGIDLDYLTPEATTFTIGQTNSIPVKSYARFEDQDNYLAVVDRVNPEKGHTDITVKPFIMMFDQSVMFDIRWQYKAATDQVPNPDNSNAKSLEQTIADLIKQYWIESGDEEQNLPLNIIITSQTTNWSFGFVGDEDNGNFCIVEFYDGILQNALMRYRVAINTELDLVNNLINVSIGVPQETRVIETMFPEVNVIEFTIGKLDSDINKLEIWNSERYTEKEYYYLHNDGTYDTDSTKDRITPINMEVISCAPERDGDTVTKSFADVAKEQAKQRFEDLRWKNYVELELGLHNIFNANTLKIGQIVQIVHLGKTYETILTGKIIGSVLTLIFGTIRSDLTKKTQLTASTVYTDSKSVAKYSNTSNSNVPAKTVISITEIGNMTTQVSGDTLSFIKN